MVHSLLAKGFTAASALTMRFRAEQRISFISPPFPPEGVVSFFVCSLVINRATLLGFQRFPSRLLFESFSFFFNSKIASGISMDFSLHFELETQGFGGFGDLELNLEILELIFHSFVYV